MTDAEFNFREYKSFARLFSRRLRKGARPIKGLIIHPADSELTQAQKLQQGHILQAKGKTYLLDKFLDSIKWAEKFKNGYAFTYYLCPRDYHRVHMPLDGNILETHYVPGELWPVNSLSANAITQLFAINERVISYVQTHRGTVAIAMVGATNVGKITLSFESQIITNQKSRKPITITHSPAKHLSCGEEFGVFNMGSTVIVIYEDSVLSPNEFNNIKLGLVKMGESLY